MKIVKQAQLFVLCIFCIFFFLLSEKVDGAIYDFATVASPIIVTGDANDHDIVSYHGDEDLYKVSGSFSDESMFGVIVDDPVLYMESVISLTDGARPVVRHGEAIVNVSTLGGEIHAGDIITTSPILGLGQRAEQEDATYILGFALDSMTLSGEKVTYDGNEVMLGTVPTALRIGPYLTREGIAFLSTGKQYLTNEGEIVWTGNVTVDSSETSAFKMFRFFLATIIAVTSIVVSIGRFGETFKQSVVSIGRNPLARAQIRSILFLNILLIIFISGVGLAVAAALIIVP